MKQNDRDARNVGTVSDALTMAESLFRTVDSGVSIERWQFLPQLTEQAPLGQEAKPEAAMIVSIDAFLPGGKFIGRGIVKIKGIIFAVTVRFDVSPTGEIRIESASCVKSEEPSTDRPLSNAGRATEAAHKAIDSVLAILSAHLKQLVPGSGHSIMELKGLGKEIWHNMDAQEYVQRERSSWNG